MEHTNAAAASRETAFINNNFNRIDFFDQDESDVADILLLLSNSIPTNPNDDFSLTRESQSFPPVWVCKKRRSATKRAAKPPAASDTRDKEKICIKKELAPSPPTPLLMFSSTESDEKLKRKIRRVQNKKRQVLKKNVEGLVGCRDSLREELQKVRAYHSHLQTINLALKTMKQDLSTTTTTTSTSNGNGNRCVVIQHQQQQKQQQKQPYNNIIVNQKAAEASCSSSINCSWPTQIQNFHQQSSSRSQLGMGTFLFLSSGTGHHFVVNNRPDFKVHPSDVRSAFSDAAAEKKAKCAAARRLRMVNNKMKQTRRLSSSSSSSTVKIKMQAPTPTPTLMYR